MNTYRFSSFPLNKILFVIFIVFILFGSSVSAYAIFNIPVIWLTRLIIIFSGFILLPIFIRKLLPNSTIFFIMVIYFLILNLISYYSGTYSALFQTDNITTYNEYIILRFFMLFSFYITATITYYLLTIGKYEKMLTSLVNVGVMVSCIALYCYLAIHFGWYVPRRNVLSTSGGIHNNIINYTVNVGTHKDGFKQLKHILIQLFFWLMLSLFIVFTIKMKSILSGVSLKFTLACMLLIVFVFCIALYFYLAMHFGWHIPGFNILSISGGPHNNISAVAVHRVGTAFVNVSRATGAFQEPSFLAYWLILPLFAAYAKLKNVLSLNTLKFTIIAFVFLVTLSLSGYLSVFIASYIVTIALVLKFTSAKTYYYRISSIICISLACFVLLSTYMILNSSHSISSSNIFSVMFDRLLNLAEHGLSNTNRNYIFEYIKENMPNLFYGPGLGNPNIIFEHYLNIRVISSFLSLYINFLYSGGLPALILLIIFLGLPIFRWLFISSLRLKFDELCLVTGYIAILINNGFNYQEVNIPLGVAYGFMVYLTHKSRCSTFENRSLSC